jgi:hypothetical protein
MKYGQLTLGQIEAVINKIGGAEGVKALLAGQIVVQSVRHYIDCESTPQIAPGWSVHEHNFRESFLKWDPTKVELFLSKDQINGKDIRGSELHKVVPARFALNANVLDYLLRHTELIPDAWKQDENGRTLYVHFWGTIFKTDNDIMIVRHLYWDGGKWCNHYSTFYTRWYKNEPAAMCTIL